MNAQITPEFFIAMAGVLLSLGFSYIPGLESRFGKLDGIHKRLVMLGSLAVSVLVVFGLTCLGWSSALGLPGLACDQAGALGFVRAFGVAAIASQATYLLTPKK
jgi:hypothetical protein